MYGCNLFLRAAMSWKLDKPGASMYGPLHSNPSAKPYVLTTSRVGQEGTWAERKTRFRAGAAIRNAYGSHGHPFEGQNRRWRHTAVSAPEFYNLDKPNAPVGALSYYLDRARRTGGRVLEPMCGSGRLSHSHVAGRRSDRWCRTLRRRCCRLAEFVHVVSGSM